MTGAYSQPFDLPSEECLVLVCSYIDHLLATASQHSTLNNNNNSINNSIIDALKMTPTTPPRDLPTPPDDPPPRRSLDYVAERPNGSVERVIGEEYGIGTGYDEDDLRRQREKIALRFSSKTIPSIPISDYLERIRKYNDVRTPMLLTLAIYLDRIEYPPLNKLNIHRFVLAGLRIAAKFLEDLVWKHDRYAKVVGVTTRELSRLELEFEIVVNIEQLSDMALRLRKGFGNGKGNGNGNDNG